MNTIRSATIIRREASMLAADVLALCAEHEKNLPPECFLRGMADYAAPGDLVPLPAKLTWFGEWSGYSYFDVFLPHVAPKIRGTLEVVWHWSEGEPSGLRVVDGVVTEPAVRHVLASDNPADEEHARRVKAVEARMREWAAGESRRDKQVAAGMREALKILRGEA